MEVVYILTVADPEITLKFKSKKEAIAIRNQLKEQDFVAKVSFTKELD